MSSTKKIPGIIPTTYCKLDAMFCTHMKNDFTSVQNLHNIFFHSYKLTKVLTEKKCETTLEDLKSCMNDIQGLFSKNSEDSLMARLTVGKIISNFIINKRDEEFVLTVLYAKCIFCYVKGMIQ